MRVPIRWFSHAFDPMSFFRRRLHYALPLLLAACGDGAGSDIDIGPVPVTDVVAPEVQTSLPLSGRRAPAQLRLLGGATDSTAVARATYQLDGGAETPLTLTRGLPADPKRAFFDTSIPLPGGPHTLVVHAYDEAGNRGSGPLLEFVVDAAAPQVQLATPAALTIAADTVRVRATVTEDYNLGSVELVRGTDATQATLRYLAADRGRVTQFAVDTLVTLAVGANEINLVARDSVGNETRVKVAATRTAAPAPARFDAVAAYRSHGCGLRSGAAFCWGSGDTGELGTGRSIPRDTPVPVAGGLAFASLSAGYARTCGVTPAGEAYCWGTDFFGALGRGTTSAGRHATPQRVASDVKFAAVSAGWDYTTCALSAEGDAYCWGANSSGQAGVPRSTGSCTLGTTASPCVVTPARVQGGIRFTSLSTGGGATCGVAVDGRAYCWGAGPLGGTGATSTETPLPVAGGLAFAGISVGGSSACGVTTGGEAYCWGSNQGGALGDGTTENRATPTRVASTVRFRSVGVIPDLAGTGAGACAQAEDGAVYCWGAGRSVPARLEGGLAFTRLAPNHRCGVTADRSAYCWTPTTAPVPVPGDYP
jgi:alpha-tubulin suppressor-like RCC1 family protein